MLAFTSLECGITEIFAHFLPKEYSWLFLRKTNVLITIQIVEINVMLYKIATLIILYIKHK